MKNIPPILGSQLPWETEKQTSVLASAPGKNDLLVSVVIPSFNQGKYIEETIRSILLQNYHRIEIIIIDGGSTDDTVEILKHYDSYVYWISEKDEGQADAINKGLRIAKGDILTYLNSDDYLLEGSIEKVVKTFIEYPGVGLVFGDCYAINTSNKKSIIIYGESFDSKAMIKKGRFIPQQGTFWSREVYEKTGEFDVTLHFALDHDFFIRVGKHCHPKYLGIPLAVFRFHDMNKSVLSEHKHWKEVIKVSRRHGLRPYTVWFWIRICQHYLLKLLPVGLQMKIRKKLNRGQDPILMNLS